MAALTLTVDTYRDRVLGGWQGKSAGITLGAGRRGQLPPGRLTYYDPVPGQPVASVALDFPLIWLEVVDQVGPNIVPEDLAVAWLEHLDYSQDEFGYAALNLRRGLPPPASGAHANWFRQATGGAMRADFWAMLAPGAPQVAAAYAYHDAKIDHSEEGLWAAMFLAALGSAAFFLTDPLTLLTIGLAMIPRNCRSARAVKAAIAAAQRGASWMEARESVQKEVGHSNFTDAPQNLGFFTIGLFYGFGDFGSALCAAVNCGYDSEVVGGALGAVLGFRYGASGLPARWIEPLGDLVIPGNGVRDFDTPRTLTEVAERTVEAGRRVVEARCPAVEIVERVEPAPEPTATSADRSESETASEAWATPEPEPGTPSPASTEIGAPNALDAELDALQARLKPQEVALPAEETVDAPPPILTPQSVSAASAAVLGTSSAASPLAASEAPSDSTPDLTTAIAWADSTLVKPLLITSPYALVERVGPFDVVMDAGDSPVVVYNQSKRLAFTLANRGSEPFQGRITLLAPPGWQIGEPAGFGQRQYLAAKTGILRADYTLRVPEGQGRIDIANAITLNLTPEAGGAPWEAEFLLLGASCWWTVGPFANFDGEGFDRAYGPEERPGLHETYYGRAGQVSWQKWAFPECALDLEAVFKQSPGVCYGFTTLRSKVARAARLVANTNSGVKVWLNGAQVLRRFHREPFRPQLGSGPWAVDVTLQAGDNPVLVKWVRANEPFAFSLTISDRQGRGLPEVGNTSW
jgi:ADP-ribosylglycohydrolase